MSSPSKEIPAETLSTFDSLPMKGRANSELDIDLAAYPDPKEAQKLDDEFRFDLQLYADGPVLSERQALGEFSFDLQRYDDKSADASPMPLDTLTSNDELPPVSGENGTNLVDGGFKIDFNAYQAPIKEGLKIKEGDPWHNRFATIAPHILTTAQVLYLDDETGENAEVKSEVLSLFHAQVRTIGLVPLEQVDDRNTVPNHEKTDRFKSVLLDVREKNPDIDEKLLVLALTRMHESNASLEQVEAYISNPEMSLNDPKLQRAIILAADVVVSSRPESLTEVELGEYETLILEKANDLNHAGIFFIHRDDTRGEHSLEYYHAINGIECGSCAHETDQKLQEATDKMSDISDKVEELYNQQVEQDNIAKLQDEIDREALSRNEIDPALAYWLMMQQLRLLEENLVTTFDAEYVSEGLPDSVASILSYPPVNPYGRPNPVSDKSSGFGFSFGNLFSSFVESLSADTSNSGLWEKVAQERRVDMGASGGASVSFQAGLINRTGDLGSVRRGRNGLLPRLQTKKVDHQSGRVVVKPDGEKKNSLINKTNPLDNFSLYNRPSTVPVSASRFNGIGADLLMHSDMTGGLKVQVKERVGFGQGQRDIEVGSEVVSLSGILSSNGAAILKDGKSGHTRLDHDELVGETNQSSQQPIKVLTPVLEVDQDIELETETLEVRVGSRLENAFKQVQQKQSQTTRHEGRIEKKTEVGVVQSRIGSQNRRDVKVQNKHVSTEASSVQGQTSHSKEKIQIEGQVAVSTYNHRLSRPVRVAQADVKEKEETAQQEVMTENEKVSSQFELDAPTVKQQVVDTQGDLARDDNATKVSNDDSDSPHLQRNPRQEKRKLRSYSYSTAALALASQTSSLSVSNRMSAMQLTKQALVQAISNSNYHSLALAV